MKNARLIIGIVSFILFFIILFQSCAAGVVNSMAGSSDVGGSAGLIVAFMVVIAGIIAIVCRKNATGSIIAGVVYALSGIVGLSNSNVYKDLSIWGVLFIIFAIFYIISGIKQKKSGKTL